MTKNLKDIANTVKEKAARPAVSAVLDDGSLVEALHRPEENRTVFCVSDGEELLLETEGECAFHSVVLRGAGGTAPAAGARRRLERELERLLG